MDRPARNKKSVDYSQFLDLEDDDEDFASSAPVSKKARVETKKERKEKPIKKNHKEETITTNSQKKRLPLEDKLYQRDLEVALALSAKETSAIIENDENIPRNEAPEDPYRFIKDPDVSEASFSNCSVDSSTLGLDEITDDNEDPGRGRDHRQAASKAITEQRKLLTEESGDEEDADEFNPDTMAVTVNIKPLAAQNPAASSPAASKAALHYSPPVGVKRPAWTPPGSSGAVRSPLAGVTVKSPNQGLRLGLSRLARVKPLHPATVLR
ncbi:unnamed protein product [Ranitomeya imitator]|uniref:RAD51 interacting motif domain-containing protein n=1 Tax=Ranitomeya imitator TaxID=111125 RepID=A0ABN9LNA7_9NEOB|nr:unnamed protein product [Ranitomeya imitator]